MSSGSDTQYSTCKQPSATDNNDAEKLNRFSVFPQMIPELRSPKCTDYGLNRESLLNGYFFCANCKKYEGALLVRPSQKRSKRYKCTGNHTSFDHPTTTANFGVVAWEI